MVDLASSVMEWNHVRHIPVESETGDLIGVVTARDLVTAAATRGANAVRDLMRTDLVRIEPETDLRGAFNAMLGSDLGCLMVVSHGRLMGIVTERDLLDAAALMLPKQAE